MPCIDFAKLVRRRALTESHRVENGGAANGYDKAGNLLNFGSVSVNLSSFSWWDGLGGYDPNSPLFSVTHTEMVSVGARAAAQPDVQLNPSSADLAAITAKNRQAALAFNAYLGGLSQANPYANAASLASRVSFVDRMEKSGAPWDFKDQPSQGKHPELDDFGNYHYGVIVHAVGLPDWFSAWAAGLASWRNFRSVGKSAPASFGNPWSGWPYGDNPENQILIALGQSESYGN